MTPDGERGETLQPRVEDAGYRLLVVSPGKTIGEELESCMARDGLDYFVQPTGGQPPPPWRPDAVVYDLTEADRRMVESLPAEAPAPNGPTLAAVSPDHLEAPRLHIASDDVIVCPWRPGELALRVQRLLDAAMPAPAPGVIRAGDLVIDTNRYDVFLAGRPVLLTFKEYELLKLLASNPGRVYRRDMLLEQVWGYAYFGGTRTVDVHVRRLRSKIEDAQHTFIDTVWNVGYRFRAIDSCYGYGNGKQEVICFLLHNPVFCHRYPTGRAVMVSRDVVAVRSAGDNVACGVCPGRANREGSSTLPAPRR